MGNPSGPSRPVVLFGICGGIAAYKAADVVSRLARHEVDIHVAMSDAAQEFVKPLTFQAVTGRPVATRMFAEPEAARREDIYPHLFPASKADVFMVLPATADMIAKIAHGYADDLIAASAVATGPACLRFFCPAMNTGMWHQPVTQSNVRLLEEAGWHRIGPDAGALACGEEGDGRMTEPDEIVARLLAALQVRRSLEGRRVLVVSGPTREPVADGIFISTASTGRTGKALAEEAVMRGATVDFVTGPVAEAERPRGPRLSVYPVTTAREMLAAASKAGERAEIILLLPAVPQPRESVSAAPVANVAKELCARKRAHQVVIGFAVSENLAESAARDTLREYAVDAVVLNAPAAGGQMGAYAFLDGAQGRSMKTWGSLAKRDGAARVMDEAARLAGASL